jgi:hypothetical protein
MWTHFILALMYATRLPAMRRQRMVPDSNAPRGAQMAELPPKTRRKADNYNHLLEQPTVFYAVALGLAVAGDATPWSMCLAWMYVILRVVHSLVQVSRNHIPTRFVLFALSSLVLIGLTARGLWWIC